MKKHYGHRITKRERAAVDVLYGAHGSFITDTRPATFQEKGHSLASKERRKWYLVNRAGDIGITATPQGADQVMRVYKPVE